MRQVTGVPGLPVSPDCFESRGNFAQKPRNGVVAAAVSRQPCLEWLFQARQSRKQGMDAGLEFGLVLRRWRQAQARGCQVNETALQRVLPQRSGPQPPERISRRRQSGGRYSRSCKIFSTSCTSVANSARRAHCETGTTAWQAAVTGITLVPESCSLRRRGLPATLRATAAPSRSHCQKDDYAGARDALFERYRTYLLWAQGVRVSACIREQDGARESAGQALPPV